MTAGHYDHLNEDSVPIRGSRRNSRPRTKKRPAHLDAAPARVIAVDRGRYRCAPIDRDAVWPSHGDTPEVVTAMRARELTKTSIVVGDEVMLVGDLSGNEGSLARVVRVSPRRTVLRRSADDTDPVERTLVANVDQMAIVAAVTDPTPRLGLIDRCLVAAIDSGIRPLLVVTKTDLGDPTMLVDAYAGLEVDHVTTARGAELSPLRDALANRATVFVGHSGVGKSSLVNALVPEAERRIGAVNVVTGRGRHTSSSALALPLPADETPGGWIIDTPGIRSFGLAHVRPADVVAAFPDVAAGTAACPRSCSHDEPDCGLDQWVATGHSTPARLASLRRLLASMREPAG